MRHRLPVSILSVCLLVSILLSGCVTNTADIEDGAYYTASAFESAGDTANAGRDGSEEAVEGGEYTEDSGSSKADTLGGLSDSEGSGTGSGYNNDSTDSSLTAGELADMNLYGPGGISRDSEMTPMERYGLTEDEITAMTWLEYLRLPLRDYKVIDDKTVEYRGHTYRKKSYVKAILALGLDTHDDLSIQKEFGTRPLADGVFVIAHDTARNEMKVVMIPRDTMIECDCYDPKTDVKYGEEVLHITQAFSERKNSIDGCENVKAAVERLLPGVKIDKYMACNLSVINSVTAAVDGITVTIPNEELKNVDPQWTMGKTVTLTSKDAERFVRHRSLEQSSGGTGPVVRMAQHRQFILGFVDAVKKKSRSDSNIVLDIYDIVQKQMITNLKKEEFLKLGMNGLTSSFNSDNIVTVPGMEEAFEYTQVYTDYEQAIPIILDLFYEKIE